MKIHCSLILSSESKISDLYKTAKKIRGISAKNLLASSAAIITVKNDSRIKARNVEVIIELDEPFVIHGVNSPNRQYAEMQPGFPYDSISLKYSNIGDNDSIKIYVWFCYNVREKDNAENSYLTATVDCMEQKRISLSETKRRLKICH